MPTINRIRRFTWRTLRLSAIVVIYGLFVVLTVFWVRSYYRGETFQRNSETGTRISTAHIFGIETIDWDQDAWILLSGKGAVGFYRTQTNVSRNNLPNVPKLLPRTYWYTVTAPPGFPEDGSLTSNPSPFWRFWFQDISSSFYGTENIGMWTDHTIGATIPYYALISVPALVVMLHLLSLRRAAKRRTNGLCPICRYNLRAHHPGDKCPECGTAIANTNAGIVHETPASEKPSASGHAIFLGPRKIDP